MALACNDVDKRSRRPTLVERDRDMQAVCRIVGPEPAYLGTFDNLLLAQSLQLESVEFEENNHPDFQPELACVHAVRDMSQCGAARLKASFAAMRIFREQKTASGSFSTNVCYQNLKLDVPCIQKSY